MDIFNLRCYKINKFLLSCHGQWVYQSVAKKRLARSLSFFSVTTTLYLQLLLLVKCIETDVKLWSTGYESEILHNYAESGRSYTLLYIGKYSWKSKYVGYLSFTVVTFITASMVPIVLDIIIPLNETRPKQLVYAAKFPIDENKYFNWLLLHGCITAFYNVSVLYSCDSMFAVATQHACGLFAIISYRLKKAVKMISSDSNIVDNYNEVSYFIQRHNYAMRYSEILESLYSPYLFFTIGGNIITISVVLTQTINSLDSMIHMIKFGSFALAITYHVYVISLPAQNLLDNSFGVANDACLENWYDMPEKSKKLLTMIIMQSYRPCQLTAGKIATIDMITFSKILKTSLSYFTMLSSLR